jgi:hypothetical protein
MAHDQQENMVEDYRMSNSKFVLEGAAFNKTFGQVQLAEVRTGYYIAMRHYTETISVPAPMTARKVVFGDGRTQPGDIWPLLNHNGADSLALALYMV